MNDEKHYIENIIEDFICKKIKYQELFDNKQLLFDKLDKIFNNLDITNSYYYFYLSSYIFTFIKKISFVYEVAPKNVCNVFKNIIHELFIDIFKLKHIDLYVKELLENLCNNCLYFCNFINDYKEFNEEIKQIFVREYCIASFSSILMIPIVRIKNYKLWCYIQSIWVIYDNIRDTKDLNNKIKMINNTSLFFKEKIYNKSYEEIYDYILKNEDICLKLLKNIFDLDNLSKEDKINICKKFSKLYNFSYSDKGFKNEKESLGKNTLNISILKSKLSLDIFAYSFDFININIEKIYMFCFIIQLTDDFIDLQEDINNSNNTIFLEDNQTNKCINIIILIEYINTYFPELNNFALLLYIISIDYNKQLLEDDFVNYIKQKLNIDYNNFNLIEIFNIFMNIDLIKKILLMYLSNITNYDYEKMSKDEILNKIKSI